MDNKATQIESDILRHHRKQRCRLFSNLVYLKLQSSLMSMV